MEMKRGVATYLIIAALVAVVLLLIYSFDFEFTGYAVLPYDNPTDCEDAGYVWENITNETCTIETIYVNEIGFIDSLGHTLTGPANASNFSVTEAWNITNPSALVLISAGDYSVNSATGVVTNATSIVYLDVNFTYTYEEETCIDVVIGEQCVGDVCAVGFSELCLDETNCTDVEVGGSWYDGNCYDEQPVCAVGFLELCLDETNCTDVEVGGSWYDANNDGNLTCNTEEECIPNTCESLSYTCGNPDDGCGVTLNCETCDVDYECSAGSCVALIGADEDSGGSSAQVMVGPSFKLEAEEISGVSLSSGNSQDLTWSINNIGRNAVNTCSVKSLGDYALWISASEDTLNINAGEIGVFAFSVLVPEETAEDSYLLSVSVECFETAVAKDFTVEVITPGSEAGAEEGTPVGGFAIFGEDGIIGTGGAVVFLVVVLALVTVLLFTRRLKKSGRTLKDVFNKDYFSNLRLKFRKSSK